MAFSRGPQTVSLFKMGGISLGIHLVLIVLLSLNPWPMIVKAQPTIYAVSLVSVPLPEPNVPEPNVPKPTPPPAPKEEIPKPVKKPKKDDIVEKVKKPSKKVEKPKEEKPKEEKVSLKHLQEALEEIRKKVALEEIQKRVSRRERTEERPTVTPPVTPPVTPLMTPPPTPSITSSKTSPRLESKLNEYYQKVWAKIKEEWTIPENLLKEMVDLETIIVLIIEKDGKIQRSWFEKKSGNDLYDQTAMRAIKKAEPFPPIPKELSEDTLEIGIRFYPD
jgi:TonB family protein